ncbi:MAG: hypothetical protein ACR2N7_07255 [Acidimicrobiia bacterium]
MSSHVGQCFSCRRELSTHRLLAETLVELRDTELVAPARIVPNVMAEIVPWAVPEPARDRRLPVATAAAVATATAAAGSAVLFRLYRQRTA